MSGPLPPLERVLPTLNADGTRRRLRPEPAHGRFFKWRAVVAWSLLAFFIGLPFVKMNGKPVVLLDIPAREFTLFGRTFLPTDSFLLMLLLLSIFVGIFWLTALFGRVWCGWGCPQTVYLEFVFRPIERWIEGGRAGQLRIDRKGGSARRWLKRGVFLILAAFVANVFLAYFVGVDALSRWVRQSPLEHPTPFLVMAVTTGLVFFDFAYFREQMCTVICPYARLQSVLLDTRSLIVGYDVKRGEPRARGKAREGLGDCIDCGACVRTCPTGIDIRDGLQLECVACTQCVDACDSIMDKIKKPRGLIRLAPQQELEPGKTKRPLLRPRVVLYPLILVGLLTALTVVGKDAPQAEIKVLRALDAPFRVQGEQVHNPVRIRIHNRSDSANEYRIELRGDPQGTLIAPENPMKLRPHENRATTVFVVNPRAAFQNGEIPVHFYVSDGKLVAKDLPYRLLGPESNPTQPDNKPLQTDRVDQVR